MTDVKPQEQIKEELTKEEIQNIVSILQAFKGYNIQEAGYMNNLIIKLKKM